MSSVRLLLTDNPFPDTNNKLRFRLKVKDKDGSGKSWLQTQPITEFWETGLWMESQFGKSTNSLSDWADLKEAPGHNPLWTADHKKWSFYVKGDDELFHILLRFDVSRAF